MKPDHHAAKTPEGTGLRLAAPVAAVLMASTLTACANLGVEPWERDYLARDEMLLDGDPVDDALDDQSTSARKPPAAGAVSPGAAAAATSA